MTIPKLTGLEYYWLGQSKSVAMHYALHWDAELDPAISDIVLTIQNDAEHCYAGSQSLLKLSERLSNEAADIELTSAASKSTDDKTKNDTRCALALRCLSSRFLISADHLYKLKNV